MVILSDTTKIPPSNYERLVIIGTETKVARMIIPLLLKKRKNLLLVTKSPEVLQKQYPTTAVTDVQNIAGVLNPSDLILNFSDDVRDFSEVKAINFITLKRKIKEKNKIIASYGYIYDEQSIRLALLPNLSKFIFNFVSAFFVTTHIDDLIDFIMHLNEQEIPLQPFVTDGKLHNPVYNGMKRIMDVAGAFFIFLALGWLMIICWLLVKLSSVGMGLFIQKRFGRYGRLFDCYKFRTMVQGTKQAGTHEVSAQAITPVGRFLRKTRLDELPQIFNIFKGEMSLVGPRPCLPMQTALINERKKKGVDQLVPGVTGLAQILGVDMSNPTKLASIDYDYLKRRTLLLDIKMIFLTLTKTHQDYHEVN